MTERDMGLAEICQIEIREILGWNLIHFKGHML